MATETETRYTTGAIIAITSEGEGDYTCTQVEEQDTIPKAPDAATNIINIGTSVGPATIKGQIDIKTLSITVTLRIFGVNLGTFNGSLKTGIRVKLNLGVGKGSAAIQLRNNNEVWFTYSVKPIIGSSKNGEHKIVTLPI